MKQDTATELAIPDLQRRLLILGYDLGDEADAGMFGPCTATAVASYKATAGLGYDDVLDQNTWIAIVDASMQMGDRLLYLHMPHFRGRDVSELQAALSSMGFRCAMDSIFGYETQQALKEFQTNMLLNATGILDEQTLDAIARFRHIWEGKRGMSVDGKQRSFDVPCKNLENTAICFFGLDEPTRELANKIANLARATTLETGVVSASSLEREPGKDMVLVGIVRADEAPAEANRNKEEVLALTFDMSSSFVADFARILKEAERAQKRIALVLGKEAALQAEHSISSLELAAHIFNALCDALKD